VKEKFEIVPWSEWYAQRSEFGLLRDLMSLFLHATYWRTPDYKRFKDKDEKKRFADFARDEVVGCVAEELKSACIAKGVKLSRDVMHEFSLMHLTFAKPLPKCERDRLGLIVDHLLVQLKYYEVKRVLNETVWSKQITRELPPTIWYHGERGYSHDMLSPIVVTQEEHDALQQFLKRKTSLDTRELENCGITNATRVIGDLADKYGKRFAVSIRTPGGEKGVGYFIRVSAVAKDSIS
jgi:hypothetical protein